MMNYRTTEVPYGYVTGDPNWSSDFDFIPRNGAADMDFITGDVDNVDFIAGEAGDVDFITGEGGDVDFIPDSAGDVDFIPGAGGDWGDDLDFIPPEDPASQDEAPLDVGMGLDVKVGDINFGGKGGRRRKKRGEWYERKPGRTNTKKLPDGVHYMPDAGMYRWVHYDREGKAVERLSVTPPTPKQLAKARQNFNRSRGFLGTGIGASSQPLDVRPKDASDYIGKSNVQDFWGLKDAGKSTDQAGTPATEKAGPSVPNILGGPDAATPEQPTPEQPTQQQPPVAQPTRQADMGAKGARTTAPGITKPEQEYEFNWRVMELGEMTPSHDSATMQPRPDYPPELQPRDRERASSEQQVAKIARDLRPREVLDDTHMLDMGPPIVGPDGAVESGSGRAMGIQRAAAAHPDKYKAYVDELKKPETLQRVGIKPEDIEGIKEPVLVRERATPMDSAQRHAFAIEANEPRAMASSPAEQAMVHARSFNDQELARMDIPDTASTAEVLLSQANKDVANRFLGSFSANQIAQLADDKGMLNKAGLDAMQASLFSRTYGSVRGGKALAQELQENVDEDLKRIGQSLEDSLPAVAKSEALVRSGQRKPQYAIAEDIAVAVQTLRKLKRQQMPVENYLRSYTIDDSGLTPTQKRLLVFFDTNRNSQRVMADFLRDYATFVANQPDKNQGAMGGMAPAPQSKADFIEARVPVPELKGVVDRDLSFRERQHSPETMAAAAIGKKRRQGMA